MTVPDGMIFSRGSWAVIISSPIHAAPQSCTSAGNSERYQGG